MDRYFYSIEECGNTKEIHISGNVYFNDVDDSDACYRLAEWTGFYLTMEELRLLLNEDSFFDYINERVDYLGDKTEQEANHICKIYHNGEPGTELDIRDINSSTPCGNYWFEG